MPFPSCWILKSIQIRIFWTVYVVRYWGKDSAFFPCILYSHPHDFYWKDRHEGNGQCRASHTQKQFRENVSSAIWCPAPLLTWSGCLDAFLLTCILLFLCVLLEVSLWASHSGCESCQPGDTNAAEGANGARHIRQHLWCYKLDTGFC